MSASLDALVRKHPEIAPAAATLRILATALPDATLPAGVPHEGAVQARLTAGVPGLEGEPLLSGSGVRSNLRLLIESLKGAGLDLSPLADTLERSLSSADWEEVARAAQCGAWDTIAAMSLRTGIEQDVATTLLDHATRPVLRAGARSIAGAVAQSRWSRGICPACGAPPLLGELRGGGVSGSAEHERVLRCGRCATAWNSPRLRCVSCGESNHRQLAYLHGAGEDSFRRAEICTTCNSYLKTIAVLAPLDYMELLTADLVTAALDIAAVERDFHR